MAHMIGLATSMWPPPVDMASLGASKLPPMVAFLIHFIHLKLFVQMAALTNVWISSILFKIFIFQVGNFIDDPSAVVSMVRGCNILPLGGVDACQQQVLFGYRIITCKFLSRQNLFKIRIFQQLMLLLFLIFSGYCYSDYCNGSAGRRRTLKQISFLLIFSLFLSLFIKMV